MSDDKVKTVPIQGRALRVSEAQPLDWFEELYARADGGGQGVPWANMQTHPSFATWLETHDLRGEGQRALVVGCGMGDDAVELESRGFQVTAFDVAQSAIAHCKQRFPQVDVEFMQADLFEPPTEWAAAFDFVLEIYTVQAVPPAYERIAIQNIAGFVAPGGRALVIAVVGAGERSFEDGPPWLLAPRHVEGFASHGLQVEEREVGERGESGASTYVTSFVRPA